VVATSPHQGSGSGTGYAPGDFITADGQLGLTGSVFQVVDLTNNREDFQGNPGGNNLNGGSGTEADYSDGITVHNNLYSGTDGNCIVFDGIANIVTNNNDCIQDTEANDAGYGNPLAQVPSIRVNVDTGAGGVAQSGTNFDWDTTGVWAISNQNSVTCAPGTYPSSCQAITSTTAQLQLIYGGAGRPYSDENLPNGEGAYPADATLFRKYDLQMMVPRRSCTTGVVSSCTNNGDDAIYTTGETPLDHLGHACWNLPGVIFHYSHDCVADFGLESWPDEVIP
jgi:hypothetical protein